MNENKHTPGPWFIENEGIVTQANVVGDIICNAPREECEESYKTWPVNAHLISAAPELLGELTRTAEDINTIFDNWGKWESNELREHLEGMQSNVVRAKNKAEGKS